MNLFDQFMNTKIDFMLWQLNNAVINMEVDVFLDILCLFFVFIPRSRIVVFGTYVVAVFVVCFSATPSGAQANF